MLNKAKKIAFISIFILCSNTCFLTSGVLLAPVGITDSAVKVNVARGPIQEAYEKAIENRYIRNHIGRPFDAEKYIKRDKVGSDGEYLSFYGLICIAYVSPDSGIFERLIEQRKKLEEELIEAGMEDCFSFVPAESYHVTICDIDPSAAYDCAKSGVTQNQVAERVEQVAEAFKEMGVPGKITSEVVGWGLTGAVIALVKFQDTEMLKKVLELENIIKSHAGVSVREFAGHITYGYLTKEPKDWDKYLKILLNMQVFH